MAKTIKERMEELNKDNYETLSKLKKHINKIMYYERLGGGYYDKPNRGKRK